MKTEEETKILDKMRGALYLLDLEYNTYSGIDGIDGTIICLSPKMIKRRKYNPARWLLFPAKLPHLGRMFEGGVERGATNSTFALVRWLTT